VQLQTGEATQDIEEMVVLFCKFLGSSIPEGYPINVAMTKFGAVLIEFCREKPTGPLHDVIDCMRNVLDMCSAGRHQVPFALAYALSVRFCVPHSDGNYGEAMAILGGVVASYPHGDGPSSYWEEVSPQSLCSSDQLRILRRGNFSLSYVSQLFSAEFVSSCIHPGHGRARGAALDNISWVARI